MGPASSVRMGDYKLIESFRSGEVELYNLKADLGEQNNLAALMPELAERMKQMLVDWRTEVDAPVVKDNHK
jgi:arylsulfatase A-like enzyme